MNAWFDNDNQGMSYTLSEDVGAPELRNPRHSAIHAQSWLGRIFQRMLG